jgi:hypothetical protein
MAPVVPIAVMKGDNEGDEFWSTPQMLNTFRLSDVSQFYVELHSNAWVHAASFACSRNCMMQDSAYSGFTQNQLVYLNMRVLTVRNVMNTRYPCTS